MFSLLWLVVLSNAVLTDADGVGRYNLFRVSGALDKWNEFKEKYGKTYAPEEENVHMEAFMKNLIHIEKHNEEHRLGKKTFKMGLNHLADLPSSEYRKLNGYRQRRSFGDPIRKRRTKFVAPLNVEVSKVRAEGLQVPKSVDWRKHGIVTPVKNQGMCSSCWAFSATGALEGQYARITRKLVSLSEQNLVDCSTDYGNYGCDGGLMDFAFQYIKDNLGVDTEKSYPYVGIDMTCHFNKSNVGAKDKGYVDLPTGDEEALKIAVATRGPISVAIDASIESFQLYKKGVYYEPACSSVNLDHGVLVVGYGTDPKGGDYWIVKNSWGATWGDNGYILMARNRNNNCGIASNASYPLV